MARSHGIDVSKWNVSVVVPKLTPLPVDFAVQRYSYGTIADQRLDEIHATLKLTVPVLMGYHYFSSGADWKQQADRYLNLAEGRGAAAHWLDYEGAFNNLTKTTAINAGKWVDYVKRDSGLKVGLYTSPSIWKEYLQPHVDWILRVPFWIAQYWFFPSPDKNPGMKGMNRQTWDFYQYTEKGDGHAYGAASIKIDLNVFNGGVPEMNKWLGLGTDPTPPTPPDEDTALREWDLHNKTAREKIDELKRGA